MEKQNKKGLLKVALAFFVFLSLIYGIGYLFFSTDIGGNGSRRPRQIGLAALVRCDPARFLGWCLPGIPETRKPGDACLYPGSCHALLRSDNGIFPAA